MNDKNFMILIGAIIVGVIGGLLLFGGESSSSGTFIGDPLEVADGGTPNENGEIQRADHVKGPSDAEVLIIEYADFECPACAAFTPELQQIMDTYSEDVQVVFRHNPLTTLHPNAFAAHRAAVAASNQDAFWEMHDLLYERFISWSAQQSGLTVSQAAETFEGYATELGLDVEQFREDVASQATFDFIDSHLDSGRQLGVTGTPTVFINGEQVEERSFEELSAIIDQILESSDSGEEGAAEADATEPDNTVPAN